MRELHPDALYSTAETRGFLGCETTKLYELIGKVTLLARKLGSATRIMGRDIIGCRDQLPTLAPHKQRAA